MLKERRLHIGAPREETSAIDRSGFVQQPDKVVDRCAFTTYPYSLYFTHVKNNFFSKQLNSAPAMLLLFVGFAYVLYLA